MALSNVSRKDTRLFNLVLCKRLLKCSEGLFCPQIVNCTIFSQMSHKDKEGTNFANYFCCIAFKVLTLLHHCVLKSLTLECLTTPLVSKVVSSLPQKKRF